MSCKSEFEKLRTSSEPKEIYKSAMAYYDQEDYVKAQTLFEIVIPYYRGNKEAEDLYFKYANTHFYLQEYILASHYYKNFATTYYSSDKKEEAEYMAAYSKYKLSPNHRLDQTSSLEAIDAFQNFTNNFPESERVAECNKLIDELRDKLEEKAFNEGKLYFDLNRYDSSIRAFENMLKDYPDAQQAEEVRFLILKSSYLLAKNSIYEKKKERFEQCIVKYELFNKKYSKSSFSKEAEKIYSNSLNELNTFNHVGHKDASTESRS